MYKLVSVLVINIAFIFNALAQSNIILGCMDPQATNYNAIANTPQGNCQYKLTNYKPKNPIVLSKELEEISGMVYWDGKLWAINDGGHPPILYALDTSTGQILQRISLQGATNIDWENITQSDSTFFIGDVGNNAKGNRKNLKIYTIPKHEITNQVQQIITTKQYGEIHFSYSDQTDFSANTGNSTSFDCEAMVYFRDSLHLFSKNWTGGNSKHYSLSAKNGSHTAQFIDSIPTAGNLVTDAAVASFDNIVLTTYTRKGTCALLLLYGFNSQPNFLTQANKRWVNLPGAMILGQFESICFKNPAQGWVAGEAFKKSLLSVSQRTHQINILAFIGPYYKSQPVNNQYIGAIRFSQAVQGFQYFNGNTWQSVPLQ